MTGSARVIGGEHDPVYIDDVGGKRFESLRQAGGQPVPEAEPNNAQAEKYKKYFTFDGGAWKPATRNVYHDDTF